MSRRYMKQAEFSAIIAGLRTLQTHGDDSGLLDGVDIDSDGIEKLIDALCLDEIQLEIAEDETEPRFAAVLPYGGFPDELAHRRRAKLLDRVLETFTPDRSDGSVRKFMDLHLCKPFAVVEVYGTRIHEGAEFAPANAEGLRPCGSPYCECEPGSCTHPGCYDARGTEP